MKGLLPRGGQDDPQGPSEKRIRRLKDAVAQQVVDEASEKSSRPLLAETYLTNFLPNDASMTLKEVADFPIHAILAGLYVQGRERVYCTWR